VLGLTDTEASFGRTTLRVTVFTESFTDAVITAEVATVPVELAVNGAVVLPAGTVTDPGTLTLASLDDRVTVTPPEPAGDAKVTVPSVELPARIVVYWRANPDTVGCG
jgi:hypothetical protein